MKHTLLTTFLILASISISNANTADLPIQPIVDTQVRVERADIDVLILATALELRGQTLGSSMVTFSPAARTALRADNFNYTGFGRPRYTLIRLVESKTNSDQIEVGAIMTFIDALLRRISVSVLLMCTWSDDGQHIAVNAATANGLTPPQLQMTLSIVPANRVPRDLLTKTSHAELLPWIIANCATDAELVSGDTKDYFLFAMVYDRLAPGAGMKILIADEPGGTSGQAGNFRDLNYDNWHVAVLRGTFNWKAGKTFYVKVIHTRSIDASGTQVIGILSSQLMPVDGDGRPIIPGSIVGGTNNRDDPGGENDGSNLTISDYNSISNPDKVKSNLTKFNKLPIVNFEIGTVSGGSFDAPVWIKFYPSGTYDPDGNIVLFEMDMDGDGTYDISKRTLTGGSFEFTVPGKYTTIVRVTDDKGGITTTTKSFIITNPNTAYVEPLKVYQPVEERKPTDVELDKKLDSIIAEYKYQDKKLTTTAKETDIVYQEPIKNEEKPPKLAPKSEKISEYEEKDILPIINGNLLINGSFEEPVVGSFKGFGVGQEIAGWKVVIAPVDLVGTYFKSSDGKQSIDLHGSPGFGAIEQTFRTEPHKKYNVTFDMSGNSGGEPKLKKIQVSAAGDSEDFEFDCTGKTTQQMGWTTKTWSFTAINKSTTLTFATLHNTGNASAGPVIDNVKVTYIESEKAVEKLHKPKTIISDGSTIQLTADSYVYAYSYRNWNEANFGQSEFLRVGWHSTGGEQRGYLKFDLPNINADDLISAQLKLFIKETVGNRSLKFGVYNVLESWEEGFGTFHSGESEPIDSSGAIIWDYQPKFDDSVFAEFKLRRKRDRTIKVDITALVKSWLANNSNYGLLLKPQGYLSGRVPTSIYEIYSKEYQDPSKHPILILDIKE